MNESPPSTGRTDQAHQTGPSDHRTAGDGSSPAPPRPSWFRQVTFHSVLAGLCPIIPVPFLDDRILAGVRRKMVRELAAERGIELDAERTDVLAGTRGERRGCLGGAFWLLFSLTVRLFGKLFRKILILFAVKESVDTASRVFHEGYLLHLAFKWAPSWMGDESRPAIGADRAEALRRTVETTVAEVDPRPLEQALRRVFRGSKGVLRRGARVLASERDPISDGPDERARQGLPEAEERRLLGGLVDRLTAELWEQRGYLAALEERFRQNLSPGGTPEAPSRAPGPG